MSETKYWRCINTAGAGGELILNAVYDSFKRGNSIRFEPWVPHRGDFMHWFGTKDVYLTGERDGDGDYLVKSANPNGEGLLRADCSGAKTPQLHRAPYVEPTQPVTPLVKPTAAKQFSDLMETSSGRLYEHDWEQCACHYRAPCKYCESDHEEEADDYAERHPYDPDAAFLADRIASAKRNLDTAGPDGRPKQKPPAQPTQREKELAQMDNIESSLVRRHPLQENPVSVIATYHRLTSEKPI